jgi:hypothetical protein
MRDQHHPEEALCQGSQRREGLRQGSENWDKNITLIAAISAEGMGQSMSVEGATDGAAFEAYVKHFLVPTLKDGQVVVMDNLQAHKSRRVGKLIESVGPAYCS